MTQLSPTALEEAAKAVEQDLSRDMAAWVERYTRPCGCDDDAPEPPKGNYRSTPTRLATAAITAYLAQREKEGFVMVPREPTVAMASAPADKIAEYIEKMANAGGEVDVTDYALRVVIYRAMLAASQEQNDASN